MNTWKLSFLSSIIDGVVDTRGTLDAVRVNATLETLGRTVALDACSLSEEFIDEAAVEITTTEVVAGQIYVLKIIDADQKSVTVVQAINAGEQPSLDDYAEDVRRTLTREVNMYVQSMLECEDEPRDVPVEERLADFVIACRATGVGE